MALRVGVVGAAGRMGLAVCRAITDAPDLELAAVIDPHREGEPLSAFTDIATDLCFRGSFAENERVPIDVLVDFSVAEVARKTLRFAALHAIHAVCGTTGLTQEDLREFSEMFDSKGLSNAIICPNFAISAVLMMRVAELLAPYFDGAEIIELHHHEKRDAPSGTAIETARRMAEKRMRVIGLPFGEDPTERSILAGARGASGPANINIHSVRLNGLIAHQEILFGALGQSLTIRQDSFDRSSFMPGVLLAIRKIPSTSGLTLGLDTLLDLS